MLMKKISALLVAGVLIFGVAGSTALAMDQTRDQLRDETGDGVPDQIRAHDQLKDGTGSAGVAQAKERTQAQYRLKDGTGDGVRNQIRDRSHDRAQAGSRSMGGGMRGSRR